MIKSGWLVRICGLMAFAAQLFCGVEIRAKEIEPSLVYEPSAAIGGAPELARARELARSAGGRAVWLVELGAGDDAARGERPALLYVAGIEGDDLFGTRIMGAWIDRILERAQSDLAIRGLLETTTIYVIPQLNPDAAATLTAPPYRATAVNTRPHDDDHDNLTDEDGPEDLNGDGVITWMRVQDGRGDLTPDPLDPRLMIKADPARGESGGWSVYPEGADNDGDEMWNEDDLGGVNLNRNWPYDYDFFGVQAGVHQISEPETRALAEFIVARPNIAVVFAFGEPDNLTSPPEAEKGSGLADKKNAEPRPRKPATGVNEDDLPFLRRMGEIYREAVGLEKELPGARRPGALHEWMYYHRGRWAFSARPWFPEFQLALNQTAEDKPTTPTLASDDVTTETLKTSPPTPSPEPTRKPQADVGAKPAPEPATLGDGAAPETSAGEKAEAKAKPRGKKGKGGEEGDGRGKEDREFLKWLVTRTDVGFAPWTPVETTEFPGEKVEIGGFTPLARKFPPEPDREAMIARHGDFLTTLTLRLPRVEISETTVKPLGDAVFEIRVKVRNTGYLPTVPAQGVVTRQVTPTRLILDLPQERIWSGERVTRLKPIPGSGGMEEVRYTVIAPPGSPPARLKVESTLAGSAETMVEWKNTD